MAITTTWKRTRTLAVLGLAMLMLTCGGGGGGGSTPAIPTTPSGPPTSQDYVVFAWNDLGMHCLNPGYDHAVILPPYNTVWAQVIKRGNPPQVATAGLSVQYRMIDNTYSYGKVAVGRWNFSQFWDNMRSLFGTTRPANLGLNLVDAGIQNGLSGAMVAKTDHFQVNGIPLTPINDSDLTHENPYQVAEITVKDGSGAVLAQTRTTVPTSFEISCGLCHTGNGDPLLDVIIKHNAGVPSVTLSTTAPVLCASCHPSPALASAGSGTPLPKYLSEAMHGFHAGKTSPGGAPITCYDCHPGLTAKCNRSVRHTAADGNCAACHGTLAEVASSITSGARIPWQAEKSTCATCHNAAGAIAQVDTAGALYRNSIGHGGLSCPACHGSPHAMVPSSQASDNYQVHQYMGSLPGAARPEKSIGSCGVCHSASRGPGGGASAADFAEEHGSGRTSACSVCHTGFTSPGNAALWPHQFQWKAR
jgi:hypothetical protein